MTGPFRLAAACTLALGLTLTGCKEAEDLGDLLGSTVPDVDAGFQPESQPPGLTDHVVTLREAAASGDRITLEVVVTEVSEMISGLAMKLTYPAGFSTFVGCSDGDLFQPGTCLGAENPPDSGEVFISRSIQAPEPPVAVSGSRTIVRLEFRVTDFGQGDIVFEGQNLGGSDATALLDPNGDPIRMDWFEGMLVGD